VDFVPVRRKSTKEWETVDVRRPESLWCQTGVIFVIGQETLLFGGYMQRGVEIRHASEWDNNNKRAKFEFDASTTRSHDFFDLRASNLNSPPQMGLLSISDPKKQCRILTCPCGVLELYSRGRSRSGEMTPPLQVK
jgi:hypothetical protein